MRLYFAEVDETERETEDMHVHIEEETDETEHDMGGVQMNRKRRFSQTAKLSKLLAALKQLELSFI
jgi:hypothetical protein